MEPVEHLLGDLACPLTAAGEQHVVALLAEFISESVAVTSGAYSSDVLQANR